MSEDHAQKLIKLYNSAPINHMCKPKLHIYPDHAEIIMRILPHFFHAGGNVHGSVYFKMLDDACFFAAQALETSYFLVTTSFTTYLTRPVSTGTLYVTGKVVNQNKTQFITEGVLIDDNNNEIGRGSGLFVRSKIKLDDKVGYS